MMALLQDAPRHVSSTFSGEQLSMARKTASAVPASTMGRPKAISLEADQLDYIAQCLRDSADMVADAAKFMRDNKLPRLTLPAAKMLDEHLPAVMVFCRRAFAEVGPAAAAHHMKRPTRLEMNQAKHEKRKERKTSP